MCIRYVCLLCVSYCSSHTKKLNLRQFTKHRLHTFTTITPLTCASVKMTTARTNTTSNKWIYLFDRTYSCCSLQSELVGASIAEPPRPHHRSLDKGIINAILGKFSAQLSSTLLLPPNAGEELCGWKTETPGRASAVGVKSVLLILSW